MEESRRYFEPGDVVSHATLRTEDLLGSFVNALRWACPDRELSLDDWTVPGFYDSEAAQWELERLFDTLSELAPEGCTFGAHEGDGSLFGFWPID